MSLPAISFKIRIEASWQDSKRELQPFTAELYMPVAMNSASAVQGCKSSTSHVGKGATTYSHFVSKVMDVKSIKAFH